MNNVIPFVKLDFYTLKPYFKSILMLPLLGIFFTVTMKTTSWLTTYLMVGMATIIIYPFSIGETNKMDILYGTLPLTRRAIVRGRYSFALVANIIACTLTLALSLVLTALLGLEENITETVMTIAVIIPLLSLTTAIQFPLYFKWGYNKVKLISMMPFFIIFILVMLGQRIAEQLGIDLSFLDTIANMNPALLFIPAVIIALALLGVSYLISCKIYTHRDL